MASTVYLLDSLERVLAVKEYLSSQASDASEAIIIAPDTHLKRAGISQAEVPTWPLAGDDSIQGVLLQIGRIGQIVIEMGCDKGRAAKLVELVLPFVDDGGELLFRPGSWGSDNDRLEFQLWVVNLYSQARKRANGGEAVAASAATLSAFVGGVTVGDSVTAIVRRGSSVFKPAFENAARIVNERNKGHVRALTLESKESVTFSALGKTQSLGREPSYGHIDHERKLPRVTSRYYSAPGTSLIKLYGRGLFTVGDVVPPESFRFPHERNRKNARLANKPGLVDVISDYHGSVTHLPGNYFFFDSEFPSHFGHLISEQLPRLWGWAKAKETFPDLKILFILRSLEHYPEMEIEYLKAFGIDAADIVWSYTPVTVDGVVATMPMYQNQAPNYAYPQVVDLFQRVTTSFLDGAVAPNCPKIFVSRRSRFGSRACRNTGELEAWFKERNFEIIYPEELTVEDQAAVFHQAGTIVGFGGSAMFNLIHAKPDANVVVLSHTGYTARNEHLLSTVVGFDLTYVWSDPDIQHPEGGWSAEAYTSSWVFDFAKDEKLLKRALAGRN